MKIIAQIALTLLILIQAPLVSAQEQSPLESFLQWLPRVAAQEGNGEEFLPRLDTDNDLIYDDEDLCINVPEDYDNYEDTDGCPEVSFNPAELQPQYAQLEPMPCDSAPCTVTIEQTADLIPLLDCLFGVLTSLDGKTVYHKGPLECLVL